MIQKNLHCLNIIANDSKKSRKQEKKSLTIGKKRKITGKVIEKIY